MRKRQKLWFAGAALAMMVALSACGNAADETTGNAGNTNTGSANATNTNAADTHTNAEATGDSGQGTNGAVNEAVAPMAEMPEHLPKDFPLPDDAVISLANSGETEGKKSAMLIFTTTQDVQTVAQLYSDYFASKNMTDAGETVDDQNIIIQGTDSEAGELWSVIGGTLSAQEGVVELTVTWSEN